MLMTRCVIGICLLSFACVDANAMEAPYCGDEGVWIHVLGSGELALDNDRATASYLIWVDGQARVLVDMGAGTSLRFDEANAEINDLHAVIFTQTDVEHTGDLANFLASAYASERRRLLPMFGPAANDNNIGFTEFVQHLLDDTGPYPELNRFVEYGKDTTFLLRLTDVPSEGRQTWSAYGTNVIRLASVPVQHNDVPTVAWRVDVDQSALVFANDFNNEKDVVANFAKDANVLVASHRLPVGALGRSDSFVLPSEIAKIGARAGVDFVVLGSRGWRTFGREMNTMEVISEAFSGTQIYADDLECWGL